MIVPGYNQLIQAVKSNFIAHRSQAQHQLRVLQCCKARLAACPALRCFTAVPLNTQILVQVTQQHRQILVMLTTKIFEHYDPSHRRGFWITDLSKPKPGHRADNWYICKCLLDSPTATPVFETLPAFLLPISSATTSSQK